MTRWFLTRIDPFSTTVLPPFRLAILGPPTCSPSNRAGSPITTLSGEGHPESDLPGGFR